MRVLENNLFRGGNEVVRICGSELARDFGPGVASKLAPTSGPVRLLRVLENNFFRGGNEVVRICGSELARDFGPGVASKLAPTSGPLRLHP